MFPRKYIFKTFYAVRQKTTFAKKWKKKQQQQQKQRQNINGVTLRHELDVLRKDAHKQWKWTSLRCLHRVIIYAVPRASVGNAVFCIRFYTQSSQTYYM